MFQWKFLRQRVFEIRVQVPLHYSTMKIKISCTSRLSFFFNSRMFYYDVVFFLVTKRVFTRLHSLEQVKTLGALRERWRPGRQKWRREVDIFALLAVWLDKFVQRQSKQGHSNSLCEIKAFHQERHRTSGCCLWHQGRQRVWMGSSA